MSTAKARKLQYLLITELLEKGTVELILPDGITLEIGIVQEDETGVAKKSDDYCYVVATRGNRSAMIDTYNLGLAYEPENNEIILEDEVITERGLTIKTLDVV